MIASFSSFLFSLSFFFWVITRSMAFTHFTFTDISFVPFLDYYSLYKYTMEAILPLIVLLVPFFSVLPYQITQDTTHLDIEARI